MSAALAEIDATLNQLRGYRLDLPRTPQNAATRMRIEQEMDRWLDARLLLMSPPPTFQ